MKNNKWKKNNQKGITLVALVITVIVMLILAGVAINLTVGDNGIFKKSDEGAQIYKNAANDEASSLNDVDKEMGKLIDQYGENDINMEDYKHPEQSSNNKDRAIGTDGKAVNMDLWAYTIISEENKRVALSKLQGSGAENRAYSDDNIVDGKIQGTVPQYIKIDGKEGIYTVTNMQGTFAESTNLRIAPEIPETVTSMYLTFKDCTNLVQGTEIPENVTNIGYVFYRCTNLEGIVKVKAKNIQNCSLAFDGIKNITLQVPANSTTYSALNEKYGSNSNITIETY